MAQTRHSEQSGCFCFKPAEEEWDGCRPTSPRTISYVNAAPHVGHALEYVQADAFARYRRQLGQTVRLQTGTDDNSLKNALAAEAEGVPVQDLVSRNAQAFREVLDALAAAYDGFLQTSIDPVHRAGVATLWEACNAAGAIYRRAYRGLYCVGCEQYYTEDELTPEGLCPDRPEPIEEENYFFRLTRYAAELRARIVGGALRIAPASRRNEVLALIDGGLQDFSISRSVDRAHGWGIPVPGDPSQVVYVWFDALANYITALDAHNYRTFWPGEGGPAEGGAPPLRLHVIGKGVLRFHAVYWPAMLLAAGLPLPTDIVVHGYFTVAGRKMSKRRWGGLRPGTRTQEPSPVFPRLEVDRRGPL